MGQFVGAIQGIGEACRALDFPIVSGNVSLYNETDGRAILPTPTFGGRGAAGLARRSDRRDGGRGPCRDAGSARRALIWVQSALLAEMFGRERGRRAPPVDLATERRHGALHSGQPRPLIAAAADLSDGGLALAAFEMAEAAGLGVALDVTGTGALFGEDQARYLLAATPADAERLVAAGPAAGVARGGRRALRRGGRGAGRGAGGDGRSVGALPRGLRGGGRRLIARRAALAGGWRPA